MSQRTTERAYYGRVSTKGKPKQQMPSPSFRCERRNCGVRLEVRVLRGGDVAHVCPACERNAAGLCRDCPARLESPTRLRCKACMRRRQLDHAKRNSARRYEEKRAHVLAVQRAYQNRPEVKARMREYKKAYSREYYADATGRRVRRALQKQWRQTPKGRAYVKKYHREWYEKNREQVRDYMREYNRDNREILNAKARARHAARKAAKAASGSYTVPLSETRRAS